jgi:membrane-associated protein
MSLVHAAALDGQLADLLNAIGPVLFYLIVFGLVFAGTAFMLGVFLPFVTGDSLLFGAGIVAATAGGLNIWILAIGVGISAFLGDQVGFLLGRHFGRPYLDRRGGPRTQKAIARTEKFYRTYGWWSVVIARFIPWGRVLVPIIAGFGRMNYFRFLSANLVGAVSWGVGLTVTGYFAASIANVKVVSYVVAGVFILASIVAGIRAWRNDRTAAIVSETPPV